MKTVKFLIRDLIKETITKTAKVNDKGEFRFEFNQRYAHDNTLIVNRKQVIFFSAPGNRIHIDYSEADNSVSFFGDNRDMNAEIEQLINKKSFIYAYPYNTSIVPNSMIDYRALNPEKHRDEALGHLKKYEEFLENYHIENNSNRQFKEWTYVTARYNCYWQLMNTLQIRRFYLRDTLPDGFYDFLSDLEVVKSNNTQEILSSSEVNNFIESYMNELFNDIPRPKGLVKLSKKKLISIALEHLSEHSDGKVREIIFTKLFYQLAEKREHNLLKTYLPLFNQYVKDESMRGLILSESKELEKMIVNAEIPESAFLLNLKKDEELSSLIDEVVKNNKGKVIYIDFWGTWCGPCLREMPYAKKIQKKYRNKPVSFVYLCAISNENTWKATIADLDIEGQHYLLTDDQYALFSDFFNISGVPHYALIDKIGAIIEKETYKPSDKELIKKIDKLLK
jgi:thiol-disulfide isomerase/thioredoxin